MKATRPWRRRMHDVLFMPGPRHQRPRLKKLVWIILLITFVIIFLITVFLHPQTKSAACYIFSSGDCTNLLNRPQVSPPREFSDEETRSHVVVKEILRKPPVQSKNPKVAFLFLTRGKLHFEPLWDKFFRGHEDRFSVYVHSFREKPIYTSYNFISRYIQSDKVLRHKDGRKKKKVLKNGRVVWERTPIVDVERRLLAYSLLDPDNHQFVLLSDSCVPLHNFEYVYNYLMHTNVSFVDCYVDDGPHGTGRYSEHMMPEIDKNSFRKGSQWFTMKRQHAIIVMADSLYYRKFKNHCKPNVKRNCYANEHYFPTFFNMIDPGGIANRSVTYVDWSEGKWHPKSFRAQDVTFELLKNLTFIEESLHFTSDPKRRVLNGPCMWNSMKRPCYLFARKFYPDTLDRLMIHYSNYTSI